MVTVDIRVGLKPGVADPEGANTRKALQLLGFENVSSVSSAKAFRLELPEIKDPIQAQEQAERMCRRLLANPVVHDYSITVLEG